MRKILFCLFFLYCLIVSMILLFGRGACADISVKEYFLLYANILPFETLIRYSLFFIRQRDFYSFLLAFFNIGGNFLLFLPMGFFLPALFWRMRTMTNCFFVIFFAVFSAEILQGIFRVGVPDIDDLIVNLFGAYIGFLISKKLCFCRQALS